jgi:hypothetical protein
MEPSSAATALRIRGLTDNSTLDTVRPQAPAFPHSLGAGISSGGSRSTSRVVPDDPPDRLLALEIITHGS